MTGALAVLFLLVVAVAGQPCAQKDFGIAYNGVKVFSVSSENDTCSCLNYASDGLATFRSADVRTLKLDTLLGGPGGIQLPAGTILDLGYNVSGRQTEAGKIGYGAFGWGDSLNIVGAGTAVGTRQVRLLDVARVGSLVSIGGAYVCGGLQASYYPNVIMQEPAACSQTDPVFLHWLGIGPCGPCNGTVGCSGFSARYTGHLLAPITGDVNLIVTADDGVRLWWNNGQTPILDQWRVQNSSSYAVVLPVVAGQYYPIRIEYFQDTSSYQLVLQWFYATQSTVPVPAGNLCSASGVQVTAGSSWFGGPVTFGGPTLFSNGIGGPATPTAVRGPLQVAGAMAANGGLTVPTGQAVDVQGSTTLRVAGTSTLGVVNSGNHTVSGILAVSGATTAGGGITVPTGQSVSILGTSSLSVAGSTTLADVSSGNLAVTGVLGVSGSLSASGGITVPPARAVNVQGNSTLTVGGLITALGGLLVPTGQSVVLQGSTTLSVAGVTTVGVLNTGNHAVTGTLSVSSTSTLTGAVSIPSAPLSIGADLRATVGVALDTAFNLAGRETAAGKIGYRIATTAASADGYTLLTGIDLPANDLAVTGAAGVALASIQACANLCVTTSPCQAFVWSQFAPVNTCWLKSSAGAFATAVNGQRNLGILTGALDVVGAGISQSPGSRHVKLWDDVTVARNLNINGNLQIACPPAYAVSTNAAQFFARRPNTMHCYWGVTNSNKFFPAAQADCENSGGHLVTITSQAEWDFLFQANGVGLNTYNNGAASIWLGITDSITEGRWVWVTGESGTMDNGLPFNRWSSAQPDNSGNCATVWATAPNGGSGQGWDDTTCNQAKAYICERDF